MDFDREKFKELVLYICDQCCQDPDRLGKTKLNKILWNADKYWYLLKGESITGERYIKRQHGPVSEKLDGVLVELEREGLLRIDTIEYFDKEKFQYLPTRIPNVDFLASEELDFLNRAIEYVCNKTAVQASDETHTEAWKISAIGEEIPLYTAVMEEPGELDESDMEWALGAIEGENA